MKYVYFAFIALTAVWMVWLCIRSFTPRLPEQWRVYYTIHPAALIFYSGMFCGLLALGCLCAATGGAGPWFGALSILLFVVSYLKLMGDAIACNVAFSDELLAVRGLFGPVHTYRWEDVTAYTVRRETVRGKIRHDYDMYMLTLPERVIRVSSAEDAGRELLQVFERKRPDLKAVRLPGQNG